MKLFNSPANNTDDFGLILTRHFGRYYLNFTVYSRKSTDILIKRLYVKYVRQYPTTIGPLFVEAMAPPPHKYRIHLSLLYDEYDIIPLTPDNDLRLWEFQGHDEEHFSLTIDAHACEIRLCLEAYNVIRACPFRICSEDIFIRPANGTCIDPSKKEMKPRHRRLIDDLSLVAYKIYIAEEPEEFIRLLSPAMLSRVSEHDQTLIRQIFPYLYEYQLIPAIKNQMEKHEMQSRNEGGMITILFCAADPTDASRLRVEKEFREIDEQLLLAKQRERFNLVLPQLSLRPKDLSRAMLNAQPQIVHFSGHGTSDGMLCFENEIGRTHFVQPDALAALFEQFTDQVKCVLLNACFSDTQAKAIAQHVDYVIGMSQGISDDAAIAFSVGFYQALGAGRTIEEAYKFGCAQIRLQGIPEHLTPVLIKKEQ